jgi:hypothetical protein
MFLATTVTRVESYGRRQKLQEGERSSASLFPVLGLYCLGVFLVGGATFFVVLEMNQKRQEQLIQE